MKLPTMRVRGVHRLRRRCALQAEPDQADQCRRREDCGDSDQHSIEQR